MQIQEYGWKLFIRPATTLKIRFKQPGKTIRASQGHSIEIELGFAATLPPKALYHGTATKSVAGILLTGLEKRSRQHVHLSKDIETATKVGQRHGKVFIFEVDAEQMQADGFEFFISENGVWLTDNVPVKYLNKFFDEAN
jgi:putative RNA 2'-phosphotransferase